MRGVFFVLTSELWFSLASFFTKLAWDGWRIPGSETSFWRFLLGFAVAWVVLTQRRQGFRANRPDLVLLRGVFNSSALLIFAWALQGTLLSKANTLNMTYPVFVFLLAPFVTQQKAHPLGYGLVALAMAGTWCILQPDWSAGVNLYDGLGLLSGVVAALGVTSLDLARRHDNTFTILFYMMGVGSLISLGAWWAGGWGTPSSDPLGYGVMVLAGVSGVLGQIFITYGYGFMDARTGSVLSTARIFFATVLGLLFLQEQLDLLSWIGLAAVSLAIALTGWVKAASQKAAGPTGTGIVGK